jgi:hypothetical protein
MINNNNMRKLYTIMAILMAGVVSTAQAQTTRYLDEIFTDVSVQSDTPNWVKPFLNHWLWTFILQ